MHASFNGGPLNGSQRKLGIGGHWPPSKFNQKFWRKSENDSYLMQCLEQPKMFTKCSYWATSPMYNLCNQKKLFYPSSCVTLVYTFKRSLTFNKLWSLVKYNGDNICSQENDNIAINMLSIDTKFIIRLRKDIYY